eukprot:SAG22_NODE_14912_length_361_cov_3.935115_1_plen_38_part_01
MNLVKAIGGAKRIITPEELRLRTSLDRNPQPYRFKQG